MRELKFRAWDEVNKKMLRPFDLYKELPKLAKHEYSECGILPFTLMQCTGLKDKKSKDLYEGDVVEYKVKEHSRKAYYKVEWCEFGWWTLERINSLGWASVGKVEWDKVKKKGNVYENPKLLKNTPSRRK